MSLEADLGRLAAIKEQLAALEAEKKELEASAASLMQERGVKRWAANHPRLGTATLVESSTIRIDEAELQRSLSTDQWQSVIKVSVDQKLLEHAVATGVVPIDIVAAVSEEVPKRPYLRFSAGRPEAVD